MVIKPQFRRASDFKNGIAPVYWKRGKPGWSIEETKKGFVNRHGEKVLSLEPADIYNFTHFFDAGISGVRICNGSMDDCKWGFVNISGDYVIKPRYYNFRGFSEGLAAVNEKRDCDDVEIDCEYHFIDASGEVVIEGPFEDAGVFSEGYAPVWICEGNHNFEFDIKGCKWGLIDKNGKFSVYPGIEHINPHNYVSQGLLGVS